MKRYRVSQFYAEQARGHERQSLDWCATLEEAQQLAVAYSAFYGCLIVVDDTRPEDDGCTYLVAEYQNEATNARTIMLNALCWLWLGRVRRRWGSARRLFHPKRYLRGYRRR